MRKLWITLALTATGCAAALSLGKALGFVDPVTGGPTPEGQGVNDVVASLTGLDFIKSYGLWTGARSLFTRVGLQNIANVLSPASSWKGTFWSVLALLGVAHTPEEAKKP